MRKLLLISSLMVPLAMGVAFAQSPATPGSAKPAATKARTAASVECSKRADAQNLHGKERKKFRASCKKELAKKQ